MRCEECGKIVQDGHDDIRNVGLVKLTRIYENDDENDIAQWHDECYEKWIRERNIKWRKWGRPLNEPRMGLETKR